MDFTERSSPWLKDYIDSLRNQDIGAGYEGIVGYDIDELRTGFTVAVLEIGIVRSLFLSTWEQVKLTNKSLADCTESIRNFIAHGVEVLCVAPPPYATLVNSRLYSQGYKVRFANDSKGQMALVPVGESNDLKKLLALNRNRNLYNFVKGKNNAKNALSLIEKYAPSQLDKRRSLTGLTSTEIFNLQQGLLKEYSKSRS